MQMREVKGLDEMVKYTIEKNSGTVRENSNGKTWGNALQAAASIGDDEKIEELLLEGADINCSTGERGTALQAASRQGHVRTVRFLLERGADPTVYSMAKSGYARADFFKKGHNALIEAVRADHATVVQVLLEDESRWSVHSTFPAILEHTPPWTPLHFAAQSCSLEAALCLMERGADVCAMDGNLTTPLHLAATIRRNIVEKSKSKKSKSRDMNEGSRKVEMIKLLLNHGADATAKDSDGNTPLHCVWRSPRKGSIRSFRDENIKLEEIVQIAKLLLESGADLHTQNNKGQTPRDFCITNLPNASNTGNSSLLRSAIDVIDPQ
jgi:ankyrin repeat protein